VGSAKSVGVQGHADGFSPSRVQGQSPGREAGDVPQKLKGFCNLCPKFVTFCDKKFYTAGTPAVRALRRMRGIGVLPHPLQFFHRICTNLRSGPGRKWGRVNPPKPIGDLATDY